MKFFEDEFVKMFNNTNIDCFGNSCYLYISKDLYAKVEFVTCDFKKAYEAIKITIINKITGVIDSIILKFNDLLKTKIPSEFEDSVFIKENENKLDWYAYRPNSNDYMIIRNKIQKFINFFKRN